MPTTSICVEVTNVRTQSNLKGGILEYRVKLQDAIAGKKIAQIKARARATGNITLTSVDNEYIEVKGGLYLKLASGNLLPKVWEDLYQWLGCAIGPKERIYSLAKTAPSTFFKCECCKGIFNTVLTSLSVRI